MNHVDGARPARYPIAVAKRKPKSKPGKALSPPPSRRPSSLVDTRIIYCGDCLEQLRRLPDACVDLVYIDPPFNSNRNYEVFWGEAKEKRVSEDQHASTAAYIDYMRLRCVELARVLKRTGSFYYHRNGRTSRSFQGLTDQLHPIRGTDLVRDTRLDCHQNVPIGDSPIAERTAYASA